MRFNDHDRNESGCLGTNGAAVFITFAPPDTMVPPATKCSRCGEEFLTPGLITYYREPLMVVEGHMQYLWDETGKQYLDAFAGIVTVSVGHCHPRIVEPC